MPEDEFEIYLTLLAKTLRLKDDQRDAIAAELRDHMEQRLEELIDEGLPREQAIQTALEDFGDASALAKDLTKTNPIRRQQRRHLMQTSFGTIAACAAVTFAVMIFTPTNKDGQPSQPIAAAQEAEPGTEALPTDPASVQVPKSKLWTKVVDCSDILQIDQGQGDLLKRTAALAQAVEQTVATVNEHGHAAIRVQPFEGFLIITATDPAHEEARQLLDQISVNVLKRTGLEQRIKQLREAWLELRLEEEPFLFDDSPFEWMQLNEELRELQAVD